jgi:CubicO group peptidase (beta-lactamase class C family)
MQHRRAGLLFTASLVLYCCSAVVLGLKTAAENDDEERERIREFINDVMAEHEVPGMTVAIVKDGAAYLAEGFGLADIDTGAQVTNDTLMYTASTGKAFTSALVSKVLAKYSEYTLDTPVREILGEEFEVYDGYRRFHITVRDLLSHRTDIPTSAVTFMLGEMEDRDDLLYRSRFFRPLTEFRSEFQYDNLWYTWAGRVVERLTGKLFEDVMVEEILQPLEMLDTQYISLMPEEVYDRMATPYYFDFYTGEGVRKVTWEAYSCAGAENPSGGLVSNAPDLQKWLLFQTSGGRNAEGEVVMDEELWKETLKSNMFYNWQNPSNIQPQAPVTYSEDNYALGWYTGYYRGYPLHSHAGALWGFWSRDSILSSGPGVSGSGVYMVANGPWGPNAGAAQHKIEMFVWDLFLGEEPWVNVTTPFAELPPSTTMEHEPSERMLNSRNAALEEKYGAEFIKTRIQEHERLLATRTDINNMKGARDVNSVLPKSKYAGTFGTYCCGNATVTHNPLTDTLSATYGGCGQINLVELDPEEHVFIMLFREPFWFIPPVETLQFFSDDGGETINSLVVPFMLYQDPPIMYRDLTMDTQPEMPGDCSS